MSFPPFAARPLKPDSESRRARLVIAIAVIGIAATLLAYAVSPSVRHAVSHAAHSVKKAVTHVVDPDSGSAGKKKAVGQAGSSTSPTGGTPAPAGKTSTTPASP